MVADELAEEQGTNDEVRQLRNPFDQHLSLPSVQS